MRLLGLSGLVTTVGPAVGLDVFSVLAAVL